MGTVTMGNLEKALKLAALGMHVFPFTTYTDSTGKTRKKPLTRNGHLDATTDKETIATWFTLDHVSASTGVGVNCGASKIVALDIDVKGGKNGFDTIDREWLDVTPTWSQDTPSGGKHHVYREPEGAKGLGPAAPYRELEGLDRRAGSSWIGWYGDAPGSLEPLAEAPEWLCDPVERGSSIGFNGKYEEWLGGVPGGEPTETVRRIITELPVDNFGHQEIVEITYRLVRLAAEGHTGVDWAFKKLHDKWVRPPYDRPENLKELGDAILGAIRKAGAEDQRISDLPAYGDILNSLPAGFDLSTVTGAPCKKSEWFSAIRSLASSELSDDSIAGLVWSGPRLIGWSREWGIDYLFEQIAIARSDSASIGANPSIVERVKHAPSISLLTEEERRAVECEYTFIDRYMEWIDSRVNKYNTPYHLLSAWTVLSLGFGMFGFLPYESRNHGVNFFGIGLGESSSGKSDAIGMRTKVEKQIFSDDPGYDIGSDASVQALQATLIERDGMPSFFNADEAAGVFKQMNEARHLDGLVDSLTYYYEGYVKPVLRTGNREISGKSAMTSFNITMLGTPDRVTDSLNRDLFLSGFLARFGWWIGEPGDDSDAQYEESQSTSAHVEEEIDPVAQAFALEFRTMRALIGEGKRHPVLGTDAALRRLSENRKNMKLAVVGDHNFDIMESAVRRLGDIVRKFSALLALSEGLTRYDVRHTVIAISHAEYLLANLVKVASMISSGAFERECAEIEAWIKGSANGGSVSEAQVYHRFRSLIKFDVRELDSRLHFLERSDRLVKIEATGSKGTRWAINMNGGGE